MSPYKRLRNLRNGSPLAKAIYGVAVWLVIGLVRTLISYLLHGDRGLAATIDEFVFGTVILAFVMPSLWLATRLEQRLKGRFPVWHTSLALFLTLVPSLVIGSWVAVAVTMALF
jgi:hypothetical protein